MLRLLVLVLLVVVSVTRAEMSLKNELDRAILQDLHIFVSSLLSKDLKDKTALDLVEFATWLNPQHEKFRAIKEKLLFDDPVAPVGDTDAAKLAGMIMSRQKEFEEVDRRILYVLIANKVDPSNIDAIVQIEGFKRSGYDLSLEGKTSSLASPELVDLVQLAAQKEEEKKRLEEENAEVLKAYNTKLSVEEINEFLDTMKLNSFRYSESTVCNAINQLTHKFYWRGLQFKVSGKRVSVTSTQEATNGAIFYFGPIPIPSVEEYNLRNKTLRQVLDHMIIRLNLDYIVKDGEVLFYDSPVTELSNMSVDGLDVSELQNALKDYDLEAIKKYRGKEVKCNGIITGIGRGMGRDSIFFAMEGGSVKVLIDVERVEEKPYKRLKDRLKVWSENDGLKKYRQAVKEAEEKGEEIDRRSIVSPMQYVVFTAVLKEITGRNLVFTNTKSIALVGPGEFLVSPQQ